VVIPDHFVRLPPYSRRQCETDERIAGKHQAHLYDVGRGGICHQVWWKKAHPAGEILLHPIPMLQPTGIRRIGYRGGVTDVAISLAKGRLWFKVPPR
jgi:3-isopropylmalate/(R)-2-methylmalate dehydratase large subunit